MAFQILPQEFNILSDNYVIRTRVPMAEITDGMVLIRVRNANLTAGDKVVVQCMSHGYDTLLHEAEYRVVGRSDVLVTRELNDRDIRQVNETSFVIARKGEWWASPAASLDALEGETVSPLDIRWNPGKQAHEVVSGDRVLASFTRDEGGKAAAEAFLREGRAAA